MDISGELMENNPTKTSALSELWGGGVGSWKVLGSILAKRASGCCQTSAWISVSVGRGLR